jgi:hypothetical protein
MNTRKVVAIWHHEGSEYQVPRVNSNFHRGVIEQPWRTGPKPLDIVQVQCMAQAVSSLAAALCMKPVTRCCWHVNTGQR